MYSTTYIRHTAYMIMLVLFLTFVAQQAHAHSHYQAVQTLTPWISGDPMLGSAFGLTVRLDNDHLFVADVLAQPIGNPISGVIYVYTKINGQWVNTQVISTLGSFDLDGLLVIEAQEDWLMFSVYATPAGPTPSEKTFQGSVQIYKLNRHNGQYEFFQSLDGNTPGLENLAAFPIVGFPVVTLEALALQQGAYFGLYLSLDAKHGRLMVGAECQPTPDSSAVNPGAAYAFELGNDGFWHLTQTIYSPDGPSDQDSFGAVVTIKGNHALITNGKVKITPKAGPILDNGNSTVYVYRFSQHTNMWEYTGQSITGDQQTTPVVPETTTQLADSFGAIMALHKKWAFIAAPMESIDPAIASFTGAVYIYKLEKKYGVERYVRKQKIKSSDLQDIFFGYTRIGTSGNRVVISDSGRSGPGNIPYQGGILVLKLECDKWEKEETLFDPDGFMNNLFGAGVDIQGNTIVGGATADIILDFSLLGFPIGAPFHIPYFTTLPLAPAKVVIFEESKINQ